MPDVRQNAASSAAQPPAASQEGVTRRQVLRAGMFATIGALFSTMAGTGAAMVWPIKITGFGAPIPAPKKVHEIQEGEVITVREGKYYLTKTPDGLMALYWRCVHLGCTVPWNEAMGKFACPCHGSIYEITGQNIAGPAPRPLDYMDIEVQDDGTVIVNTGKIHQRSKHEPHHATKV